MAKELLINYLKCVQNYPDPAEEFKKALDELIVYLEAEMHDANDITMVGYILDNVMAVLHGEEVCDIAESFTEVRIAQQIMWKIPK